MSGAEIASIIATLTGLSAPFGAAVTWVYREIKTIKADLVKCSQSNTIKTFVVELLWLVVEENYPSHPVLGQAKKLLEELKDMEKEP